MKTRQGLLGRCTACQDTIPSHFDPKTGLWRGCTRINAEPLVFMLVPLPLHPTLDLAALPIRPARPRAGQRLLRAAYRTTVPKGTDLVTEIPFRISPNRRRVLTAVMTFNYEHHTQPLTRDLVELTGMSRGIVSEALVWLRSRNLVVAVSTNDVRVTS